MRKFFSDVLVAAETLVTVPLLLAITVGLAAVPAAFPPQAAILVLPIGLFETGWAGTQQLWAARLERGEEAPPDLWRTTWRYLGRYFVLGLLFIPVVAIALVFAFRSDGADVGFTGGGRVLMALVLIPIEVVLTFVFPALALSTRSVSAAFRIGWSLLSDNWRADAWYAIAPAVTLQSAYSFVAPAFDTGVAVGVVTAAGLATLGLLFRVTITREYLRLVDVTGEQPVA